MKLEKRLRKAGYGEHYFHYCYSEEERKSKEIAIIDSTDWITGVQWIYGKPTFFSKETRVAERIGWHIIILAYKVKADKHDI